MSSIQLRETRKGKVFTLLAVTLLIVLVVLVIRPGFSAANNLSAPPWMGVSTPVVYTHTSPTYRNTATDAYLFTSSAPLTEAVLSPLIGASWLRSSGSTESTCLSRPVLSEAENNQTLDTELTGLPQLPDVNVQLVCVTSLRSATVEGMWDTAVWVTRDVY